MGNFVNMFLILLNLLYFLCDIWPLYIAQLALSAIFSQ